eukprot:scaffold91255_cov75-Attheya_sp.AAC.6
MDIDNCIDDVYTQVTSDFTGDVPGIKIAATSPFKLEPVYALPPPPSPPTENVDFPHFSCYMGTPTNLHSTVLPADFSKYLLTARTSATDAYVDHTIPRLVCISADDSTGLLSEQGLFPLANHTIFMSANL